MKIIFDNIIFSLQQAGGISVVWQELLSRFINSEKYELSFIEYSTDWDNPFRRKLDFSKCLTISRHPLCFMLERYINPSVDINEPFIFQSSYFRICTNPNAFNVTIVHDFTYEYFQKGYTKHIHCWQKYNAIRQSDAIVCISENTKKDLMTFLPDVDEGRIHVIYNGVSEEYYPLGDKHKKCKLPFPEKTYVIFVGSRARYKNFELTVQSVAQTSYNFLIVGSKLTSNEIKEVEKYLSPQRYVATGFLSNERLNELYNNAAALIYPSSYEGFGIPVLEAQRAGCPVIAYNNSSIPEVIGDTPLLMEELTREELISKLKMLSDKMLIQRIIKNGQINSKRFSWDKMFTEYMKLYEEIWNKKGI